MPSARKAKISVVLYVLVLSILIGAAEMRAQTSMPMSDSDKPAGAQNHSAGAQTRSTVLLTTDPSPARKGSNTFRIKLTDADGNPIAGAQVTVTLFMPAMPDMGMAAMKTVVKTKDTGSGMYEGKGDLGSSGTWQVTIAAVKDKQAIATKHLTIRATGGM